MQATLDSVKATAKESAWKDLAAHHNKLRGTHLRQLFEEDPKRGERYTLEAAACFLDYSKNLVTDETLELLFALASAIDLKEHIDAMFRGEKINFTEKRAVLHTALRAPRDAVGDGGRRECRAQGSRGARQDGGFLRSGAERRMERPHREADPERDQHRDRRLRSRPGHGVRGAEALQRAVD